MLAILFLARRFWVRNNKEINLTELHVMSADCPEVFLI